MSTLIGHVDSDCFYVSAERLRFPHLRGKAVGVLGNQGAAVIARSYEMREHDIPVGMPVWEAKKRCPNGTYVKRDFRWYEVLSRKMLEVVRCFSPAVEYYSIDEFFFEVVPDRNQSPQELAEALRDEINRTVGVPVTVGIGRSRTIAKLISDFAKPAGALAATDPDLEWWLLESNPITEICGIAKRRAERLKPCAIHTALDYAFADRRIIRKLLTVVGERIWWELNGEQILELQTERPPHKMISRGGSIGKATANKDTIYGWLVRTLERLIEELEHYQVCPGALEIYVEHYQSISTKKKIILSAPTSRFDLLLEAAKDALGQTWIPSKRLHRLQLVAVNLNWPGRAQQGLFDPPAGNANSVAKIKREINKKIGRFAVRSGATLYLPDHYRDEAWSYEICDVRDKICF